MSRKTRKLIWSAPLVAVLAVAGALAMFVMLAPNGAQAHEPGADTVAHQPPDPVTGIDVVTPSGDNGGRTSLQVSWNAPTGGDAPTMYRVDISTDTDVWMNFIGGEASDEALTEADATSNCGDDDEGNRCYTVPDLKSDTLYHFRVFAMNEFGTSPISVDETLGSGRTLRIDPPDKVTGLYATDYYTDQIVVSWDKVEVTGGADVLWYCLGVAASPSRDHSPISRLTANEMACLTAIEPVGITDAGITAILDAGTSQTAVVAAMVPVLDADGDPVKDADDNVVMHGQSVLHPRQPGRRRSR